MFKAEHSANETETGEYGATEHPVDIANGTGDSYSTTLFCEQCGSLLAVWARHVDIQVVAQQHE